MTATEYSRPPDREGRSTTLKAVCGQDGRKDSAWAGTETSAAGPPRQKGTEKGAVPAGTAPNVGGTTKYDWFVMLSSR